MYRGSSKPSDIHSEHELQLSTVQQLRPVLLNNSLTGLRRVNRRPTESKILVMNGLAFAKNSTELRVCLEIPLD